jgi:hypothetical protein
LLPANFVGNTEHFAAADFPQLGSDPLPVINPIAAFGGWVAGHFQGLRFVSLTKSYEGHSA